MYVSVLKLSYNSVGPGNFTFCHMNSSVLLSRAWLYGIWCSLTERKNYLAMLVILA